jgi:hypothetical protein
MDMYIYPHLPKVAQVNVTRYAQDALRNLLLLQRTDLFIGTFSSNFGRLAYELQVPIHTVDYNPFIKSELASRA